ncbi:MAG: hypothetical protein AAGD35_07340 [Actinomycetota bacterium]
MKTRTGPLRRGIAVMGVAALLTVGGPAGAQTDDETPPDENPTDAAATEDNSRAAIVIDALLAAGVPAEAIDDDFEDHVRRSVHDLLDEGVIDADDLEQLRADVREQRADAIQERIERGQERRDKHREAVDAALAELGIEVEDGQNVGEAIRAAGLDPSDVRELLPARRRIRCVLGADGEAVEVEVAEGEVVDEVDPSRCERRVLDRDGDGERDRRERADCRDEVGADGSGAVADDGAAVGALIECFDENEVRRVPRTDRVRPGGADGDGDDVELEFEVEPDVVAPVAPSDGNRRRPAQPRRTPAPGDEQAPADDVVDEVEVEIEIEIDEPAPEAAPEEES